MSLFLPESNLPLDMSLRYDFYTLKGHYAKFWLIFSEENFRSTITADGVRRLYL